MQRKQFLLSGLIIIFVIFGLFAPQAAEARDIIINADPTATTLSMLPATGTVSSCCESVVEVMVGETTEDLTAYHLEITYDRTKVEIIKVENGGHLTPPGMGELFEPTNTLDDGTGTGRILWGMAQQGTGGDPSPVDGAGSLIKITFQPLVDTGTVTFTIEEESLLVDWPDARSIPYTVSNSALFNLTGELAITDADLKWSLTETGTYTDLEGNFTDGFEMYLDPTVEWLYLDTDTITSNNPLVDGSYPFYLAPVPEAVFYLKVAGTTYSLIDGYQFREDGTENPLRINGDFVPGTYTYTGELEDIYGSTATVSIDITFIDALAWLQANTILSSVSGTIADLTATFPASIPEIIVAEPYKINSRMTLSGEAIPAGSTITIMATVDGVGPFEYVKDAAIPVSPFWVTDLAGGTAADFDDNYAGHVEIYAITINSAGGNPLELNGNVLVESIISKDGFMTNTVLDDISLTYTIPADEAAALLWLQDNTTLSGTLANLVATFPPSIPPVIVAEDYVIDSRITFAEALPTGTKISVSRGGIPYIVDLELTGAGPFWLTDLIPGATRAAFDAGYGGAVENYVITVTGPGTNPLDFDTTVLIESVISKDGFTNETVLDDITMDVHIDDAVAPIMEEVLPAEGALLFGPDDTLVLTVDALDLNLYELEIDHSLAASLPEFSVYADALNPWGTPEDQAAFAAAGVTVSYDAGEQVWTIDFGPTITDAFIANGGITFYMVLKDMAGNTWGSMFSTTPENTYEYTVIRDAVAPVMEAVTPAEGDVYLAAGENFVLTVDAKDTNLYSLEVDHSFEGALPEFTVYASESNPYGSVEAKALFEGHGVFVTYDAAEQIWTIDFGATITDTFINESDGVTFYMVLEDMAGNTWGSMYSTTPENTFAYTLIRDAVAPVMEAVTPPEGDVYLAADETFVLTVDALDDNLYSLEVDHSFEGALPEFTVYASASNPYGSNEAKALFEGQGVFVTYDAVEQIWTIDFGASITDTFIDNSGVTFYMVLEDMAGNQWGSMYSTTSENTYEYHLIRDDEDPELVSVTPPHDSTVLLGIGDTFTLTIQAADDNLRELEIDHSMEGILPEFSVYASESDPYGGDEADFAEAGVTVTYDEDSQTWVIDFGADVSAAIANNGGITFYLVLEDMAGNTWGSMSPTTGANTFKYTVSQDLVTPTIEDMVANGAGTYTDVSAVGTTFTVDQGYTVESISITMSEPVSLLAGTEVTLAGVPYGLVTVSTDGLTLTVTPYAGNEVASSVGSFTFEIPAGSVEDLAGNALTTLSATLVVNNVAPVAVDDSYSVAEDGVLTVAARGVLTNDTDFDPTILTAVVEAEPAEGILVLNADGSFTYTPAANFNGTDTFTYKANDGLADSNVATVTITVTAVNDAPVLGSIADATIPEMVEFSFTATATDVDLPIQVLTFSLVGAPEGAAITQAGVFTWTPTEAQGPGTYNFTAKVCDDAATPLCAEKAFTINVTEVNLPPVLTEIGPKSIAAGSELTFTAEATDPDIPAQALSFSLEDAPAGAVIDATSGDFSWTPDNSFTGERTFKVCVSDTIEKVCETIVVTVGNDAPVAVNDAYEVDEDEVLNITAPGVLANDTDVNNDALTAVQPTQPANGILELAEEGGFVYTPKPNYFGEDSFTYKAFDGVGYSEVATVTITVKPVKDQVIAVDDAYSVIQGKTLDVSAADGVLKNDIDVDMNNQRATVVSGVSHGSLEFNENGAFVYTPDPDFSGEDSFVYRLVTTPRMNDDNPWEDTATVTITVYGKPVISSDDIEGPYHVGQQQLYHVSLSNPANGMTYNSVSVEIVAEGIKFADFEKIELQHPNGSDTWFDLVAMDLIVEEGNNLVMRTPVIDGMPIEPGLDYTLTFRVTFKTAGQYPVTGTLYYYPDSNGNDHGAPFEVAEFTSTMVVLEANPVAVGDAYETFIGETLTVAAPGFLANDTFAGPEALVAERVTSVSNGTLEFNPDGSFTYVPNAGYYGTDSFTYMVSAAGQFSNVATVTINVYTKPTISSDDIEGPYYVGYEQEYHMKLTNPEGGKTYNPVQIEIFAGNIVLADIETIKVEHPVQPGEWIDLKPLVVVDNDGLKLLTPIVPLPIEPNSDYTLTFLVEFKKEGTYPVTGTLYYYPDSDGTDHGERVEVANFSSAMVVLKDIPVAVEDAYETDEDVTLTVAKADGVLKNDTLNAPGTLTAVLLETVDAAHGTLTFAADGSFEFVPVENWHGTTTFTYKATDGKHESAPATVTIVVKDVKDPVQAVDDEYETNEDTVLNVPVLEGVLANDIDVDLNNQYAYIKSNPTHGTVDLKPDGSFVYTPDADFHGEDVFEYTLVTTPRINNDWTDTATVTITVKPVNDAPVLGDLTDAEIPVNKAYSFTATGTDIDSTDLTFSLKNAPADATIDGTSGVFSWTPGWDDLGPNTFQVCVSDGDLEDCKSITLTVLNVNTLDKEIRTAPDYSYPDDFQYGGDFSFDDTTNTYTVIYKPAQVLALQPRNDIARYLGALYRQNGATINAITFNGVEYTWKIDPPAAPELKGSNWRDADNKTLVSAIAAYMTSPSYDPEAGFTLTVTDGYNTETVTFIVIITNTLDAEIGSGFDYEYADEYEYVGTREFDDPNNIYTVTYDETQVNPHAMYDLARYLGALYRQEDATVIAIAYKGKTYTWDEAGTLLGSNWKDEDGNTLVSVITADFIGGHIDPAVGIVLTVADGIHTETVTFKMVITNVAPELDPIEGATIPELVEYTFTATASDVPTATLTFSLENAPAGAEIDETTGVFTWTPTEAQGPGEYTFTVKVCDDGTPVMCDDQEVTLTVTEVNIPPVLDEIGDQTVVEGVELTFTATATDEDIPAQTLTFSLKDAPVGAEIDATTGVFTWTPTAAQVGDHTFKVCVSDGVAEVCEEITVTVEESVVVNLPPVAVADAYETNEDVALIIAAPGVLENDSDPNGDAITAILVSEPEHGTLALAANGGFVYSPNADWNGTDTFTYKASDGTLESEDATVTITVNPVNDAPVAVDDAYTVAEDTLLSIAAPGVLANDSDIDGDVLNATVRTNPSHGALTLNGDGSFTYMPNADWHGTDSFTYNLVTHPAPTSGWTDWATVTITVTPVNDAPVLAPIADATIPEMVAYTFTATATDVDSTNLTFSLVGAPAGAAINASTGVFTWTPTEAQGPQAYTFTVKVCDDATPAACDQQSVKLTVTEVNRAPEIEDIEAKEVTVGEELTFTAVASDPDQPVQTLTFRLEEAPAGASINATTGKFTWTPVESQIGIHEFHVCVTDGQLNACTTVKVTVKQGHVNTPPVAVADTYAVDQDKVLTIAAPGVLANDTDADNDTLTAILVGTTSNGTLTLNADGSFVYTPRDGYYGTDTFTYKANDGKADSNVVTVTITVKKVEPVFPYGMYFPVIIKGH